MILIPCMHILTSALCTLMSIGIRRNMELCMDVHSHFCTLFVLGVTWNSALQFSVFSYVKVNVNMYHISISPACNRTYVASLTSPSGHIHSPNWPANYGINSYCESLLLAPPGYNLYLSFNHFNIESHTRCQFDYLRVGIWPKIQPCS